MTSRYESRIDRQIREAQERGDFEDLPGKGKPLSDSGTPLTEDWWLRGYLQRENVGPEALPTTLRLQRECEELPARLANESSESRVREIVADLNNRIDAARRGIAEGPPLRVGPRDVTEVVRAWHASRETRAS